MIVPSEADRLEGGRYVDGLGLHDLPIPENFAIMLDSPDAPHSMFHAYWPLARAFRHGIETGTSPSPSLLESLHLQELTEALRQSSTTGRRVDLTSV
jgi:predicted dehydrogenase